MFGFTFLCQGLLAVPHVEAGTEWSSRGFSFRITLVCRHLLDIHTDLPPRRFLVSFAYRSTSTYRFFRGLCLFNFFLSRKISEVLLLRDTTLIPNVLWFEYTNSRQEARARSRKLVSMKSQWQLLGIGGGMMDRGGILSSLVHFYWARKR